MYKMSDFDCVHILGNGPSIKCFESDFFHQEPTDGVRICCNLGIPHLNPIWTFVTQPVLFYLCEQQIDFKIPIVIELSDLVNIRERSSCVQHLKQLKYYHVIRVKSNSYRWLTSGMSACRTALTLHSPKQIHLWGFDFLWSGSVKSIQDYEFIHINKYFKSTTSHTWRDRWDSIFTENPKTQFVIHTPAPIENLPKNVSTERL